MPTSEALLPRHSSHPYLRPHPRIIPHRGPAPTGPQEKTVRSLVGCHPKETLHCCWVTSVMFSSACSDWTYAGHHVLCPLLTTMLAKSWSLNERPLQRADRHYVPPILMCGLSRVEGFDQNCLSPQRFFLGLFLRSSVSQLLFLVVLLFLVLRMAPFSYEQFFLGTAEVFHQAVHQWFIFNNSQGFFASERPPIPTFHSVLVRYGSVLVRAS